MTDADLLRWAADRIERLAAVATPGRWDYDRFDDDEPYEVVVDPPTGDVLTVVTTGTTEQAKADALWAATFGPQVAAPLAVLLRVAAAHRDDIDRLNAYVGPSPTGQTFQGYAPWTDRVIDLAKAILGEQS